MLELLDLKGALVTIDAMGCQKEIAQKIVAGGGDYVLAVKGNQEHLLEDIQATVEQALEGNLLPETVRAIHDQGTRPRAPGGTLLRGHPARRGHPRSAVVAGVDDGGYVLQRTDRQWRDHGRRFVTSLAVARWKLVNMPKLLRHHWGIENNLHWQLDISFGEDASRIQERHGAAELWPC